MSENQQVQAQNGSNASGSMKKSLTQNQQTYNVQASQMVKRKHDEVDEEVILSERNLNTFNKESQINPQQQQRSTANPLRATPEELQGRVFYKARRSVENDGEVHIEDPAVSKITEKLGAFKFANGQTLSSTTPLVNKPQLNFKFNFQANVQGNQQQPTQPNPFKASAILQDEKKFIVNKDLFSNPFINPLRPISTQSSGQDQKTAIPAVRFQMNNTTAVNPNVQQNPLSSAASIAIQQKSLDSDSKGGDEPQVKSLFEYSQNKKYVKTDDDGGKTAVITSKKFQFGSTNFSSSNTDQQSNRGLVFSTSNPFKINPGSTDYKPSMIFASGKSLFNLPSQTAPTKVEEEAKQSEQKDENEGKEEEQPQVDIKEKLESSDTSGKVYQQQVLKLKTLKGIASENKQPSRKENGYLSIEMLKDSKNVFCLAFRSFLGATLFSGIINPKISRAKELQANEHSNGKAHSNRLKAKVAVAVKDPMTGKFEVEHCEISFMVDADRKAFIESFNKVLRDAQSQPQSSSEQATD